MSYKIVINVKYLFLQINRYFDFENLNNEICEIHFYNIVISKRSLESKTYWARIIPAFNFNNCRGKGN